MKGIGPYILVTMLVSILIASGLGVVDLSSSGALAPAGASTPPTRAIVEESENNNGWPTADLLPNSYGSYELHGNLSTSSDYDYYYFNLIGGAGPVDQVTLTPTWLNDSDSGDQIVAWFWIFFPNNDRTAANPDDISMDLRMWAKPWFLTPLTVCASYSGVYGLVIRPAFSLTGAFGYNITVDISSVSPVDSYNDRGSSRELSSTSIVYSDSLNAANDMFDWYHFPAPNPIHPTILDLTVNMIGPTPDYNDGRNDWGVEVTIFVYHNSRADPMNFQLSVYRTSLRPLFQNPGGCTPPPISIKLQKNCTEMFVAIFIQAYVMDSAGSKTYGEGTGSTSYTANFRVTADIPNNRPMLSYGKVEPTKGNSKTVFTYSVVYKDKNNHTPRYIGVWLDGVHFRDLSIAPGQGMNFTQGVNFSVEVAGATIGPDAYHRFNFSAYDGKDWAIGLESGIKMFTGPVVDDNIIPGGNNYRIELKEDSPEQWVVLDQLFTDPNEGTVFSYKIKDKYGEWSNSFEDKNLTAIIVNNGTEIAPEYRLKIIMEPDVNGDFKLRLNASDNEFFEKFIEIDLGLVVAPVNDKPVIKRINSLSVDEGEVLRFYEEQGEMIEVSVIAEDIDVGDELLYDWDIISVLRGPVLDVNYGIDHLTGSLWFVSSDGDVPGFTITLTVTDSAGSSTFVQIQYDIENVNDPPMITVPPYRSTIEGEYLYINPVGYDADMDSNDVLTYGYDLGDLAKVIPSDAIEFTPETGRMVIRAANERMNGEWEVNITLSDQFGEVAWGVCRITIENVNDPPVPHNIVADVEEENLTVWFTTIEADDEDLNDQHVYIWDFGDGSNPVQGMDLRYVNHTYPGEGSFTVTMKVFDGEAFSEEMETIIRVTPPPKDPDMDNDGMDDEWEVLFGLDPADPSDALLDADNDGLTNLEEFEFFEEFGEYLNPRNPDTDGDGYKDGKEMESGYDPLDPSSHMTDQMGAIALMLWIVVVVMVLLVLITVVVLFVLKRRNRPKAYAAPVVQAPYTDYMMPAPPLYQELQPTGMQALPPGLFQGQPQPALDQAYPQQAQTGDYQAPGQFQYRPEMQPVVDGSMQDQYAYGQAPTPQYDTGSQRSEEEDLLSQIEPQYANLKLESIPAPEPQEHQPIEESTYDRPVEPVERTPGTEPMAPQTSPEIETSSAVPLPAQPEHLFMEQTQSPPLPSLPKPPKLPDL